MLEILIVVPIHLPHSGPIVAQSNGSAANTNVSYPGNLTHRGNRLHS